jgi:hypothetical protein
MEDQKIGGVSTTKGMNPPMAINNASSEAVAESTTSFVNPEGIPVWEFIKHCYEGSNGFLSSTYLFPFKRDAYYNTRRQMTKYVNLFKPAIDASVDPIFNNEIERTVTGTGDNYLLDFIENCNGAGLPLTKFMHDFARNSKLWSMCHVVVFPVDPEKVGSLPFVKIIEPQTMVSITSEKAGYATRIRWKISDKIEQEVTELSFIEYTREEGKDGKLGEWGISEEVPHGLSYSPIVQLSVDGCLMRKDELPHPTMLNIVNLCLEHFNTKSLIAIQKRFQSFSILRGSGITPQTTDVGVSNLIIQDNGATIPLDYISPDVNCLKVLFEDCTNTKTDIREAFKQIGVVGVVEAKSGIAKEWDFRAEESVLKSTSEECKNAEVKILSIVAEYLISKGLQIDVVYKDKFSPDTTSADVAMLQETLNMVANKSLKEAIEDEIAIKLFAHKPEALDKLKTMMESARKTTELTENSDGTFVDPKDNGNQE